MTDTVSRHLSRFPHARTSTILQLQKQEETTQRLRQELGMQQILQEQLRRTPVPWWKRVLDRIGGRDGAR